MKQILAAFFSDYWKLHIALFWTFERRETIAWKTVDIRSNHVLYSYLVFAIVTRWCGTFVSESPFGTKWQKGSLSRMESINRRAFYWNERVSPQLYTRSRLHSLTTIVSFAYFYCVQVLLFEKLHSWPRGERSNVHVIVCPFHQMYVIM